MLSISATRQLRSMFCGVEETKPNVWYSELANAESDKDQTEIPVSLLELFNNRDCDPCRPWLGEGTKGSLLSGLTLHLMSIMTRSQNTKSLNCNLYQEAK